MHAQVLMRHLRGWRSVKWLGLTSESVEVGVGVSILKDAVDMLC